MADPESERRIRPNFDGRPLDQEIAPACLDGKATGNPAHMSALPAQCAGNTKV